MVNSMIQQCLSQPLPSVANLEALKAKWQQDVAWPSNKSETWRYAKLQWLNEPWTLVDPTRSAKAYEAMIMQYGLSLKANDLLSLQGQFESSALDGVTVYSKQTMNTAHATWSNDFFNQLGWLGLNDWACIEVAPGQTLDTQWHCILDQPQAWQNLKLSIKVKQDAHFRLNMHLLAPFAVTNLSLDIEVEQGGHCHLIGWSAPNARILLDHQVKLHERAEFRYDSLHFEACWCHERVDVAVGKHANAMLSGLLLPALDQNDHKAIDVRHHEPHGQSMQKFYSVADANGLAAFHGRAIVNQSAPKTNARQLARAMMLSDACQVYARPELEIDIDDVQCQHGASIGELDQKALFYLRSRGIGEAEAKAMLISAFIEEIVVDLAEDVQAWVRSRIKAHAIGEKTHA